MVCPPEGGLVQLHHVHCPSWGAILLPDDHHGDCQTVGSLAGTCSYIPNSMSLASCFFTSSWRWNGTVAWDEDSMGTFHGAGGIVAELGDFLLGKIGWQLW